MFRDRGEAGRRLAQELLSYRDDPDVVVVGLPRGGVPVAREVATALGAPLDVIVVRKLGVPFRPELAMGAIGEHGARFVDDDLVRRMGVSAHDVEAVERREQREVERRARRLRTGPADVALAGRVVIVVDDGVATGSTARAACQVARAAGARRVVLAVPVAPSDWRERLQGVADDFVAAEAHRHFGAVGQFYDDFAQVSDDEVVDSLRAAREERRVFASTASAAEFDDVVLIDADDVELEGFLHVPPNAVGLVVFAHGSGSSRHSRRNRAVAATLNDAGIATLLFDLLSSAEAEVRAHVFDVELLGARLTAVQRWVQRQRGVEQLPIGLFGASTGAAAALWAAADPSSNVAAVVSRGGRPDLAGPRLASVRAPTLMIVGSRDQHVLALNLDAEQQLRCESKVVTVAGATHLFEEPGTLAAAADLARDWFLERFAAHLVT